MAKDVGDILISQSVIERNRSNSIKDTCDISNTPFLSVLGENSDEFYLFSLWIVEQLLINNTASQVFGLVYKLFIS